MLKKIPSTFLKNGFTFQYFDTFSFGFGLQVAVVNAVIKKTECKVSNYSLMPFVRQPLNAQESEMNEKKSAGKLEFWVIVSNVVKKKNTFCLFCDIK